MRRPATRRPAGDDGNALVEFTYLGVLLMVPLIYLLLTVFLVQRASFAVTEAARQAGRAYATADSAGQGQARAAAAARLAMDDQGLPCDGCVVVGGALAPDATVRATVRHVVQLPFLGALFDGRRAGIPVTSTHVAQVDRFRETR